MKRYIFVVALFNFAICMFATPIAFQGFEETPDDTWNYTPNSVSSGYWGLMDDVFGGATIHSGAMYWASWNLAANEGILTFTNTNLAPGYVYDISFYYYTRLLSAPTEYARYAVSYDNGFSFSEWTTLLPNTQAWTQVNISIPAMHTQVMLKVAAKHSGTGKYCHFDAFTLNRENATPTAPNAYNLQIAQRTDGSGIVDISYDLFDVNNDPSSITVLFSEDAGSSFNPLSGNLSGDVGANIFSGQNKHIVWDAKAANYTLQGTNYRFRILADDGTTYGTVATPIFSPEGGTYSTVQNVSIFCATEGAAVYYTTDGSEPSEASTLYSTTIQLTTDATLKAKAYKENWDASEVASAVYDINAVPTNFAYVPGGTFTMGRTTGTGDSDELPTHSVTLNSFYMAKYEVTQGEYQAVMGSNPSHTSCGIGTNYPVNQVSWYSMIKYCNLKSMNEGLAPVYTISGSTNPASWGAVPTSNNATWDAVICNWSANGYRLPTEAEWEYAARGGTNTPDFLYSGSDDVNAVAWYSSNSGSTSHPVGTKAPNSLGLYDMSGNLWEWCWDWYGSYPSTSQNNPTGASSGSGRVVRGGYWNDSATNCRVADRYGIYPGSSYGSIGFRLCRAGL